MNIGACVVLYNPYEKQVIENINTYLNFVRYLVIVDNSTKVNDIKSIYSNNDKVIYVSMNGNKGIAKALNQGLSILIDKKMDFALTMDQDSQFPIDDINEILPLINIYKKNYSVIGLNFNYNVQKKTDTIIDVDCWLTSGNFVDLDCYKEVGGFNNDLFIDYVDIEFGYKLKQKGKQIGYLKDYSLKHSIGNPIEIKIAKKVFYSMNHVPIRYYYRYRNSRFLYINNKDFYRKYYFKELFVNIPKMLLFEKNRKNKILMIKKGLQDAKIGKMGAYV